MPENCRTLLTHSALHSAGMYVLTIWTDSVPGEKKQFHSSLCKSGKWQHNQFDSAAGLLDLHVAPNRKYLKMCEYYGLKMHEPV